MILGMLCLILVLNALFTECCQLRLRERLYWVLKVHVNNLKYNQELEVYRHLAGVTMEHSGRGHIRQLKDSFKLKSRTGEHDVSVMMPLGMSLRTLQDMQKNGIFQQTLVVGALDQVLTGLNFLHEADVIHTGKYLHSPSSAGGILPANPPTIRPPLGQSAYCYYKQFSPLSGRR